MKISLAPALVGAIEDLPFFWGPAHTGTDEGRAMTFTEKLHMLLLDQIGHLCDPREVERSFQPPAPADGKPMMEDEIPF